MLYHHTAYLFRYIFILIVCVVMYAIILYMLYVYNCIKLESPGIRKHFFACKGAFSVNSIRDFLTPS